MSTATQPYRGLVDSYGNPISSRKGAKEEVYRLRQQINQMVRGKYDSAQTTIGNEIHWSQADLLDPHAANSLSVRRKLRSRSRYEVIENNCYLKGIILTIANDFVGKGPRLQVTDTRLSKERRNFIEQRYQRRNQLIKMRQKLWRWMIAKKVDGEGCAIAFDNERLRHPVKFDWEPIETDQLSHSYGEQFKPNEVDGIRFDDHFQPKAYHILDQHPGSMFPLDIMGRIKGTWVQEKFILHWFRRERGWLRGIPETTPCLPLCAILRRYTLAVLRAAEFAADIAGILSTDGPANSTFWQTFEELSAASGGEVFPMEHGAFVTLPWGYKMSQIESKHPMQVYDMFVNAILREIARPLLMPYNRAVGSSKDSNMASGVVDEQTYKGAIEHERDDCEDEILEKDLIGWWQEGVRTEDYFDEAIPVNLNPDNPNPTGKISRNMIDDFTPILMESPSLREEPPRHTFRWDQVGIVHTDPQKVAGARKQDWESGFRTDQDIIETDFNRNYDDWLSEQEEALDNRRRLALPLPGAATVGVTPDENEEDEKSSDEDEEDKAPATSESDAE